MAFQKLIQITDYFRLIQIASAIFLTLFLPKTFANDNANQPRYQPHQSLESKVHEHLKQKADQNLFNIKIEINPISSRLKLLYCKTGVELFDNAPEKRVGRMTIGLSCQQPEWRLYVTATIDGDLEVVRSSRPILKGAIISQKDVELIKVPYKQARHKAMHNLQRVIGMRAKRAIPSHQIMMVNLLLPPYLVFKDQPIKIISETSGIRVETNGIALQSGTNREQIPVRNQNSQKIIKGIIIAPNTVWIP